MSTSSSTLPDDLKDKSGAEVFRIVSHWPSDQWGPLFHPRVVSYAHKLRAESESRYNTTIAAKLKGWAKAHEFQSKVLAYKPPKPEPRYTILTLEHIFALSPPEFQVATFIPEESVTLIFGAPKVGKTFVVIDLACRIAMGMDFYGHAVRPGRVLYVASEGGARIFGKRVQAWLAEHHGASESKLTESLLVIEDSVALNEPKAVETFLTDIADAGQFGLIVFDTLLANNSGDVNSNEDMGALMRGAHDIRRKTGANVLIVHHSGRAIGSREMGAQALGAGVDAVMSLTKKDKSDVRVFRLEKSRNAEEGESIGLTLKSVRGSAVMVRSDSFGSKTPTKAWEVILCHVVREGSASISDFIDPDGAAEKLYARGTVHKEVAHLRTEGLLKPKLGGDKAPEEPLVATEAGTLTAEDYGVTPPTEAPDEDGEGDEYGGY